MDIISCKLVDWNFEPLDVWNIWFNFDKRIKNCMVLLHLSGESQTRLAILAISHNANRNVREVSTTAERTVFAKYL